MYLVIFFLLIICMLASHALAKKKAYNPVAWGLTAAMLGPIALLIIWLLPDRNR
jgi:uncharacterized membrane protein